MTRNLFGTDGIRGRFGQEPFTYQSLVSLGQAIGSWFIERYGANQPLLIARDTRESGSFITSTLLSGILSYPVNVRDAGIIPTPVAHWLATQGYARCAIIISASHNPYQDNGIKIIDAVSGKLTHDDEATLSTRALQPRQMGYEQPGTLSYFVTGQQEYHNYLLKSFGNFIVPGKKIIFDCAHGATTEIAQKIANESQGTIVCINNTPNGKNINNNAGAVHPSSLIKAVIDNHADMGCAFDGDGDRLIVVSREGTIKDGDDILALLSRDKRYESVNTLVSTVMSNFGFNQWLCKHNKRLEQVSVGDKHIIKKMNEDNLPLGGEPSGHIIIRDHLSSGDGLYTALLLIKTLKEGANNEELVTFTRLPSRILNMQVQVKKSLDDPQLQEALSTAQQIVASGRIFARYSGTEPLLRVLIEDISADQLDQAYNYLHNRLTELLS